MVVLVCAIYKQLYKIPYFIIQNIPNISYALRSIWLKYLTISKNRRIFERKNTGFSYNVKTVFIL